MAVSEEESSSSSSSSTSSSPSNSRSPKSNGVHYLSKCVLRGSVVLHVVHGHLRSPSSYDVVFAKETSIELVAIGEDGVMQSICEQPVFGIINDMAILPWNEKLRSGNSQTTGKDVLVVVSDSGKLSFLTFSNEMHKFFPLTHVQLSGPGNSIHQIGRRLAVDSSGCYIAVGAYQEHVALFSVSASSNFDMIDKRVTYPPEPEDDLISSRLQPTSNSFSVNPLSADSVGEDSDIVPPIPYTGGTIWSMCFISKSSDQLNKEPNPLLAILVNRKGSSLNELVLLEWDVRENSVHVLSRFVEGGFLALKITEVPGSRGLALLFREGDILLMDLNDSCNPTCVQTINLGSSVSMIEEHDSMEDSFRLQDDDEGFIAAHALLQLQAYGFDLNYLNKGDDPMSIDNEICHAKSVLKCECPCSWEPGADINPRMIFSVDSGEIFIIEITVDIDGTNMTLSNCLYNGHSFNTLLWTESGFVAAIVDMGDGVVLKFREGMLEFSSAIQNIAPILDMSVMDYHNEKHDQMFACCGKAPEGSLRIIRNGISVERLLRTAPIYQGITAIWTLKMRIIDSCHSFLVLSFVEETRVLSVGVSFTDVTESVGFLPNVCTLACGLVADGLLVQIDNSSVRLCLPTGVAHSDGIPMTSPACASWSPDNISISLGSVGPNLIIVATSNPCLLIVVGVKQVSMYNYELYEMHHVRLHSELSCISVPQMTCTEKGSPLPVGVDVGTTFVIGTHKPSVEILSFVGGQGVRVLATGAISLTSTAGVAVGGCIPQDVRLVMVDKLYVLSGLRNGMLLRFEWPSISWGSDLPCRKSSLFVKPDSLKIPSPAMVASQLCGVTSFEKPKDNDPVHLQLIAVRRIGITPVFLVPLTDSLDADIIALSDRPWLVQAARQSLSYISISFEPSTYVTPVYSAECPKGLLFVAENCLHLVEMVHSKRLNVQKFHLGGTPRKVLYHSESRLLLVLRTELGSESFSSDICCVDPLSGSVLSSFKFKLGETGKSMELIKVGREQVLVVVGTSLSSGPAIMSSGEPESTKGRLIVLSLEHSQNADTGSMTICSNVGSSSQQTSPLYEASGYSAEIISNSSCCSSPDENICDGVKLEDAEAWQLRLCYSTTWPGVILAICPYLEHYFLASSGNAFYVCGFPNDNPQRVRRYAIERTRFTIVSLTAYFTTIVVGDCRDGVLFYSYHEDAKKLEQMYCDPGQRLIADCLLTEPKTAFVSDRKGSFTVLTSLNHLEDNVSPERNLTVSCSYYMGEISMSITKGLFSYKLPVDDGFKECVAGNLGSDKSHYSIMAGTLLGSIVIFIPMSRDEYELLKIVQARLAVHPLTAPILGNNHNEFRSRENKVGVPTILDGDMLAQFLELTSIQQEAVLGLPCATAEVSSSFRLSHSTISVNQVVQLLERVHYALN